MKQLILIFLSFTLLSSSCKKKPIENPSVLPTNLITTINIDFGKVDVNVSADNANFYSVMYYSDIDSFYYEANDGVFTHTYVASGVYTIKSRAHITQYEYIEKIEQVNIEVNGDINAPTTGYETPLSYPGYTLVWNDEFDSPTLSSDWVFDIGQGNSGWGNNELQYYTNQNYTLSNGILEIFAKKQVINSAQYTSTRMKTQGKKSWKYGRIDVRAALPYGKGLWPAIWMLGDPISTVGWPACGEIDIMEMIGGTGFNDRTVYGTVHWDDNGHAEYGNGNSLSSGKYADEFHVFSIIWDETKIRWLRDDIQYNEVNITSAQMTEFHENFFMILNVAVGGNWPGSPDESTVFPQRMYVDYIRVFQ